MKKEFSTNSSNVLIADVRSFNSALKSFKTGMPRKNAKVKPSSPARLSFVDGFLTIMWNDITVNLRATGDWQGKAEFNCSVIFALILAPITGNELVIKYENEKLYFGTTAIKCHWTESSESFISQIKNPSVIDIFAMWRSLPAHTIHTNDIADQYNKSFEAMFRDTERIANSLKKYEITQEDLIELINHKVSQRISK